MNTRSLQGVYLCLAILILGFSSLCNARGEFFSEPRAPFLISPDEVVERVVLPEAPVAPTGFVERVFAWLRGIRPVVAAERAQELIDSARAKNPDAILFIETRGPLEVSDKPLRLGSKMCLMLSPAGGFVASSDLTAAALIAVDNAEFVSIGTMGHGLGVIDGGGKAVTGISVTGGSRINLDRLALQHCGLAGVDYTGREAGAVNQAGSLTRCDIRENGDGLRVAGTAGFQCLDNTFHKNQGAALTIHSLCSVVAGNEFSENKAAIVSASDRGVITRNLIGDVAALEITASGAGQLVTENIGTAKDLQIKIAGSTQQFFRNDLQGTATITPGSKDIYLIANTGLTVDPASPGLKFFNPPTYGHPHKDALIVAGMGRFDLPVITGGKMKKSDEEELPPVDIAVVQEALNLASTEHPNDVLVLKLQGEFVTKTLEGLQLAPNTCLILEGRILADLGLPLDRLWVRGEAVGQVVKLPKSGYSSVSGGKLDGGRQANHPLNASQGGVAVIENINITAGSRDGIYLKGHGAPAFIYRCNVYGNNARGIWPHVSSRVHSIANNCAGNYHDGIDFDAHAKDCTALFNTTTGNRRHGIFLEEGIQNTIVFGNTADNNFGAGIHTWNEAVKGNTGLNVISANQCNGNWMGTSVGGRAEDKTANENLFFNNVTRYNRRDGIRAGNRYANGNYFTQCVIGQNVEEDIALHAGAVFFNAIAPKKP